MEVLPLMPRSPDFHFSTTITPTTPPAFPHHYSSAPTSPTRPNFSFEFSFSAAPPEISTADELFDKGKIRPLAPPVAPAERGRIKTSPFSNNKNRARESRSLSPLRTQSFIKNSIFTSPSKWKLKDLLLFRSASEGRASGRYTLLSTLSSFSLKNKKKGEEEDEDCKCGSFRSSESGGGSVRRGGAPQASAHEMHYTANRAAAGEKRKKTPLAYQRQGLFSCLQFNPAIRSIAKGFSSFS